jgi:two-component system, NtrC family, C4-dicarboxylate transport response regulator DctD
MSDPGTRVLIVDDEPALLKMMGVYLTRKGFTVTTLDTTEKAWAAVEAAGPGLDAVVIDGSMQGLSALELGLKVLAANPKAAVVVASGYPVDMSRLEAAGPGRACFVQKPFTSETLAGTLRRLIAAQEKDV